LVYTIGTIPINLFENNDKTVRVTSPAFDDGKPFVITRDAGTYTPKLTSSLFLYKVPFVTSDYSLNQWTFVQKGHVIDEMYYGPIDLAPPGASADTWDLVVLVIGPSSYVFPRGPNGRTNAGAAGGSNPYGWNYVLYPAKDGWGDWTIMGDSTTAPAQVVAIP
jgi:hypothetical protein